MDGPYVPGFQLTKRALYKAIFVWKCPPSLVFCALSTLCGHLFNWAQMVYYGYQMARQKPFETPVS